jgi:hypothetical protein
LYEQHDEIGSSTEAELLASSVCFLGLKLSVNCEKVHTCGRLKAVARLRTGPGNLGRDTIAARGD